MYPDYHRKKIQSEILCVLSMIDNDPEKRDEYKKWIKEYHKRWLDGGQKNEQGSKHSIWNNPLAVDEKQANVDIFDEPELTPVKRFFFMRKRIFAESIKENDLIDLLYEPGVNYWQYKDALQSLFGQIEHLDESYLISKQNLFDEPVDQVEEDETPLLSEEGSSIEETRATEPQTEDLTTEEFIVEEPTSEAEEYSEYEEEPVSQGESIEETEAEQSEDLAENEENYDFSHVDELKNNLIYIQEVTKQRIKKREDEVEKKEKQNNIPTHEKPRGRSYSNGSAELAEEAEEETQESPGTDAVSESEPVSEPEPVSESEPKTEPMEREVEQKEENLQELVQYAKNFEDRFIDVFQDHYKKVKKLIDKIDEMDEELRKTKKLNEELKDEVEANKRLREEYQMAIGNLKKLEDDFRKIRDILNN